MRCQIGLSRNGSGYDDEDDGGGGGDDDVSIIITK